MSEEPKPVEKTEAEPQQDEQEDDGGELPEGQQLTPEEEEQRRAAKAAKNKAKKQKKKEKKKEAGPSCPVNVSEKNNPELERQRLMEVMMPRREQAPKKPVHNFWNTQPVMQLDRPFELGDDEGPLEVKKVDEVRQEPYDLPEGMEWWNPDVGNEEDMRLIYELLRDHYVEDDDAMFRFNYTPEFLAWALLPPNHVRTWHVAIRSKDNHSQLIGFISGIPVRVAARRNVVTMCEINFLCVNKHSREKGLAPVLIQEVTRRVNLLGIWQAIYTAGILITSTISQCQYWHRSLNPQKLISIGFSRVPPSFEKFARPMDQVKRHYALPDKPRIPGIRPMVKKDHKQVRVLLEAYLEKFGVHQKWTNEQICHWFLPRKDVVDTYVVQDKDGKITDMCSFYTLPSTVIGASKYKVLRAAYCYYNVANTVDLKSLLEDAMILARQQELDVFNALDIMDNLTVFKDLKFGMGDGHLRYYFYNWRFPELKPSNVGIVLL